MKLFQPSQDRDLELLSAYLDHELSASEREKLEHRLATDSHLRRTLVSLRRVQTTLTDLPRLKPPRSFVLNPNMIGQTRRTLSRLIPMLNYATTLVAILFAVVIGSELAISFQPLAAPASVQNQTEGQTESAQSESPAVELAPLVAQDQTTLKQATGTPATVESLPFAMQSPCNGSPEPLTSGGCSAGVNDSTPPQTFISPTPEGALLRATGTEPPVTLEAPTPSPAETDFYQTATETQSLSPTRLALIVLGGVLTLFLIASVIIRRR